MLRMLQPTASPTVLEKDQLPTKIAILPFANKTANPEAGSLVRKMFYNFFSSLNYQDLEPYVIDDNLKTNHLYAGIAAGKNISPQKLGQLLDGYPGSCQDRQTNIAAGRDIRRFGVEYQ